MRGLAVAFSSINRQFKTVADFTAYLATLAPPHWAHGSTYHNTYRPLEGQWAGLVSMKSMQAAYAAKGWSSGPHCYLALGSPNPANDGVWVMTPPTEPGTHAGVCNATRFGIEVVGDFNARPPSLPQQQLLIDTLVALHRWAGLGPDLVAHRDCMADRTCPGDAFYALKPQLQLRLAARLVGAGRYMARHTQAVFEAPVPDSKVALNDTAHLVEGQAVDIDEVAHGGWAHLSSGLGFVPVGVLTKL